MPRRRARGSAFSRLGELYAYLEYVSSRARSRLSRYWSSIELPELAGHAGTRKKRGSIFTAASNGREVVGIRLCSASFTLSTRLGLTATPSRRRHKVADHPVPQDRSEKESERDPATITRSDWIARSLHAARATVLEESFVASELSNIGSLLRRIYPQHVDASSLSLT